MVGAKLIDARLKKMIHVEDLRTNVFLATAVTAPGVAASIT